MEEISTTEEPSEAASADRPSPLPAAPTRSRSKSRQIPRLHSVSTKSASGSRLRLSRVLSRFLEFRGIEESDYRYFWAAYRKGAFREIEEIPENLGPQEFVDAFLEQIEIRGLSYGWTFLAPSRRGYEPVGFVWAWGRGRVVEISDMIWFPWASPRNILESTANFMNTMRKMVFDPQKPDQKYLVWEYARMKDKRFFEAMCQLGVMRRVGHIHGLYDGEPAVMFETRGP